MDNLPKGISEVKNLLKDGSYSLKYRVRKKTKDINTTKMFDTLLEAVNYLNTINTELGKALVSIELEAKEAENELLLKTINNWLNDPDLNTVVTNYINNKYLEPRDDRDISKLNSKSNISRLMRLLETQIDISKKSGFLKVPENRKEYKAFKEFTLSDLNPEIISRYIESRIDLGKSKQTIKRELTLLSAMFNTIPEFMNVQFQNPIPSARKTALDKIRTIKRKKHITNEEFDGIKINLEDEKNKEVVKIVMLASQTGLRRSEVVALEWSQVFDDYVELTETKNGEERTVWLNVEAREIIASIERIKNKPRLFTYTIEGFKSAWQRFKKKHKLSDLRFHDFRKKFITDTIQAQIEQSGIASVFGLGKALGVVDLDHFKKEYVDKEQAKYNHRSRNKNIIQTEKELQDHSAHKDYRTQNIYVTKITVPKK